MCRDESRHGTHECVRHGEGPVNRRDLLKSAVAALGMRVFARPLTDKVAVLDAGGANVVAFSTDGGLVLVDSGAPTSFAAPSKVQTIFNTHYHLDQTGNNEGYAAQGAKNHRARAHASVDVDGLL